MIAVFVNFVFANTVFVHTHQGLSGGVVTHSHPFQPSSQHGHNAQSFDQIAAFNAAANSIEGAAAPALAAPAASVSEVTIAETVGDLTAVNRSIPSRGPPFAG